MRRLAVYGTLREQGNLHKYYIGASKGSELLGTTTIKGWSMINLGAYPAIVRGDSSIVVEIYELEDHIAKRIDVMERAAGYITDTVATPFGDAMIFYMPPIAGGDWIKFNRRLENERAKQA